MPGSTYFETIPISELEARGLADRKHETSRPTPPPENRHARRSVLVVDDEQVIADTLALILSANGFCARAAYSGQAALAQARASEPEILITDVMMPGMTGIELAIAVRQTWPACRILLFSGNASTLNLLEDARKAGYDFQLLTKPVHPEELLKHLHAAEPEPLAA